MTEEKKQMNMKRKGFPKGSVCKPCWELRYCPYGPLVEYFPLLPDKEDNDTRQRYYEEAMDRLRSGKLATYEAVWSEVRRILFLDPDKWHLANVFDRADLECREWGHCCPVFWSQSAATETLIPRREGRYLPREIMLQVVRRDGQHCQLCHEYVPDSELEFDHVIPDSKGGPMIASNIRLLCHSCNRKKSNSMEGLLKER
jgi:5-methylcytosine-specific restriction endonuclease McrA